MPTAPSHNVGRCSRALPQKRLIVPQLLERLAQRFPQRRTRGTLKLHQQPLRVDTGGRGLSWTLDRDKARRFAQRETPSGRAAAVYEATVRPGYVLAIFESERPGEAELVVDPAWFDLEPPRELERLSGAPTGAQAG